MLDKIPHEVILIISRFLAFKDKLILITTCRLLFNLISNTNLYSKLDLYRFYKRTAGIVEKFKNNPSYGVQVRRLSIDIRYISDDLLIQIPTMFPNIIQFRTNAFWFEGLEDLDRYAKVSTLKWSNTLETYNIEHDCQGILPALKTATFPHLTDLTLGIYFNFQDKSEGFDFYYFLPAIKNAPSLIWLELNRCAINLELLEEIHINCPLLRSLELTQTHIIIKSDASLPSITPANSLLYLKLTDVYIFDTNGLLLDYITTKYRFLKQLQLHRQQDGYSLCAFADYYKKVDMYDLPEDEQDGVDIQTVREYKRLYDSLQDEYSDTEYLYRESGTRFFSHLTTGIKSMTIGTDFFNDTMEALATSNTQLTELYYEGRLEDPDQIQFISQINSLKVMSISICLSERVNLQILPYNSLASLTIFNKGEPVYFDWLLSSFPSLQELCIDDGYGWTVSDSLENDSVARCPNLRKFEAGVESFDQKCIDFLIKNAPNIKVLSIYSDGCGPDKRDITIDISGWELKKLYLNFKNMELEGYFHYHFKTPSIDAIIKYCKSDDSIAVMRGKACNDKPPPMFNITSTKDEQFRFHGYDISLIQGKATITLVCDNK